MQKNFTSRKFCDEKFLRLEKIFVSKKIFYEEEEILQIDFFRDKNQFFKFMRRRKKLFLDA